MWRVASFALAALLVLPDAAGAPPAAGATDKGEAELLAVGQRIYREGMLPSGHALQGTAQATVRRTRADAACETCHRRSGYGESEGMQEIRPITGPALFGQQTVRPLDTPAMADGVRPVSADSVGTSRMTVRDARIAAFAGSRQRPPYDDAALARAVREGVDVTGRTMSSGMPRYALDDDEMRALTAYLKSLSANSAPGVTPDEIHFATVIQPGVDGAKRRAMLDVFESYIEDRNRSLRSELRRERAGSVRLGRTAREWVLHVWELSGPADTWGDQLEAFIRQQPVFALIGGLGDQSWRPVHEFSEQHEVPCIFPQTEMPVVDRSGFYTVYLSKGVVLEAEALAKYLQEQGYRGIVTQVFRRDAVSTAGADAFRRAWQSASGSAPREHVLEAAPDQSFWQRLAKHGPRATLVLWLRPEDVAEAQALTEADAEVNAIYVFSSTNDGHGGAFPGSGDGRVRLVYPLDLPAAREAKVDRVRRWLQSRGVAFSDERVQMDAYLAVTVTNGVMSHAKDTFSREFLLESLEHRMGNAFESSMYPRLSLGPGQRFASKGAYIVRTEGGADPRLTPVSAWIVP